MKTRILITAMILLTIFLSRDFRSYSSENSLAQGQNERIRFQILSIEENARGERRVLSETNVEGQPGTDFNVNLQTERFRMQARFLSDLMAPDKLKIRAKLNTRRLYGQSERGLPLYEEDAQSHALELGFDEAIVLLPFGRGGGTETLKIEITPTLLNARGDAKSQPLKIEFGKQLTNGEISVQAAKIPHHFAVEAILSADGEEIARGMCDCLLEEEQKIVLQPNAKPQAAEIAGQFLTVDFTVDGYTRSRPEDSLAFRFDLRSADSEADKASVNFIAKGAGVATFNNDLSYRIEQSNLPTTRNYELKFNVRLGKGETNK